MKIKDIGEEKLITRFKKKINLDKSVLIGPGDDAAVINQRGKKLTLFTCDMLVEGVHFKRKANPRQIGHKALAVNISDIAAMGGFPTHAVVSLGLPRGIDLAFIDKIFSGMKTLADKFNVNIVGGDVNESDKLIISIALLGEASKNQLVLRSGAKLGDVIIVTGTLGGSGSGRHLKFIPRVKESLFLTENFRISSMIDISDGLSLDLLRIARASEVGAVIYESLIPAGRGANAVKKALSDGEDFELLFTVAKKYSAQVLNEFRKRQSVSIAAIGEITSRNKGVNIIDRFGRLKALKSTGFTHF